VEFIRGQAGVALASAWQFCLCLWVRGW